MSTSELRPESASHTTHEESQLVTFYVGEEEFGFDIMSVQEIIRQPSLARIPMAPSYVEGIANLRGTVLPIIDTRSRFGLARQADTDQTRVLVVDVDGVRTGLRVDRVRQVTRIQSRDVEPPPGVIRSGMSANYLQGVVTLEEGKRIIMSLDAGAICKVELGSAVNTALQADHGDLRRDVSRRQAGTADQSVAQVVSFELGQEEFAFPMDRVREILRVQPPSEVADTPEHFLGILTVRGTVLPVLDLRTLLGLPTLSSDVKDVVRETRERYRTWLAGNAAKQTSDGLEALRAWVAGFATSSEKLMETLHAIRVANDKAHRSFQLLRAREKGTADAAATEMRARAEETLERLADLESQIADHIHEDQRLVVVQAQGGVLALLVDKVREVLAVPTKLVDPPPRTGNAAESTEVLGVVRLDDGKRIIVMLDADHLAPADAFDTMRRVSGHPAANVVEQRVEERDLGKGVIVGERQFVTFRLGEGEYGIPVHAIQEIDRSSKMTRIPRSASFVDGVTNLRGEVIPVVNARKRFHLPARETDERTRVIIIDVSGKQTGLLVDSVREVLSLPETDIAAPPAAISSAIERRYISGIGKVDGGKRVVVLLDVEQVVNTEAA